MDNANRMMLEMLLSRLMGAGQGANSPLSKLNLSEEELGMVNNLFSQIRSGGTTTEEEREALLVLAAKMARQANLNPTSAAQLMGMIENFIGNDKITPEIRARINQILSGQ